MIKETPATYLFEFMLIKFKSSMPAFSDPENLTGLQTPQEVGIFFHEWMHYLHNTYTLLGLVTFNHTIGLWKTFRWSYDDKGISGTTALSEGNMKTLADILKHWEYLRMSKTPPNLSSIDDSQFDFSILSFDKVETLKMDSQSLHHIKCTVQLSKSDARHETFDTLIGTPEIIENLAWLIEDKLVFRFREFVPPANSFPYHAIEILARHLEIPDDKDTLIRCMIAALQTIDPPGALLEIFHQIKECQKQNVSIEFFVTNWLVAQFNENKLFIDTIFDRINIDFPIDEPIGLGIKEFANKLKKNLEVRKQNPFFELEIVNTPNLDIDTLNEALKKYGCCYLLQECSGQEDVIERDKLYEFATSQHDTNWQVFHAALKFIRLHIRNTNFISLEKIIPSASNMCPFYTTCAQSLRLEDNLVCKTKPWESEKWYKTKKVDYCWYATAVCKTRPDLGNL